MYRRLLWQLNVISEGHELLSAELWHLWIISEEAIRPTRLEMMNNYVVYLKCVTHMDGNFFMIFFRLSIQLFLIDPYGEII